MMLPDTEEQLFGRGVVTASTDSKDLDLETGRMVDVAEAIARQRKAPAGIRTSGKRTDQEQIALSAQGREPLGVVNALRVKAKMRPISEAENQNVVTWCNGVTVRSPHQDGRAMDYVPVDKKGRPCWPPMSDPRWLKIAECFELAGLEWGGRWKTPDYPHFQRRT